MTSIDPVTSVLFDWNGTIVDDRARAWECAAVTFERIVGRSAPSPDAIAAAWQLPLTAFFVGLGVDVQQARTAERMWNVEMAARPVPPRRRAGGQSRVGRDGRENTNRPPF